MARYLRIESPSACQLRRASTGWRGVYLCAHRDSRVTRCVGQEQEEDWPDLCPLDKQPESEGEKS